MQVFTISTFLNNILVVNYITYFQLKIKFTEYITYSQVIKLYKYEDIFVEFNIPLYKIFSIFYYGSTEL